MASVPPSPTVSVVAPTFERRERAEALAEAFLREDGLHELVVVVDGSTDGTTEALQELARSQPLLKVVARENRGIVRSRLDGVRAASGEVTLVVDDDVVPEPGLVAAHGAHHRDGGRIVVLGYMPVPDEVRRAGSFPGELYASEYETSADGWEADPATVLTGFWAGNFSMLRRHYLELAPIVGAIPDSYHEDLDFGLCCLEAGFEGIFDRSLRASHIYERDAAGFARDARRAAEGLLAVHERHPQLSPLPTVASAVAGLSGGERRLAGLAAGSGPLRRGLLGAARISGSLQLRRVSRRLGHLCWCAEEVRTLNEVAPARA